MTYLTAIDIEPSIPQYKFLVSDCKVTVFVGGIGCVSGDTLIMTDKGPVQIQHLASGANVLSFNRQTGGLEFVSSSAPIYKGETNLYQITHKQGQVVCAGHHLIYDDLGNPVFVQDLYDRRVKSSFSGNLLLTNLELCQSALPVGVPCSTRTNVGSRCDCQDDIRLCGPLPLYQSSTGLDVVPLQDDVRECASLDVPFSGDLQGKRLTRTHLCQDSFHLAMRHCGHLLPSCDSTVDLSLPVSDVLSRTHCCAKSGVSDTQVQLLQAQTYLADKIMLPAQSMLTSDAPIIGVERLPYTESYYDIHVPVNSNYVTADGTVHHNSGKTWSLAIKLLEHVSNFPNAQGMITANTYRQLSKATLAGIFKALGELDIVYDYYPSKAELWVGGTKIICASLDAFDNWRGIEVGWILCDEAAFYDRDAYLMAIGRLRDKRGPLTVHMATTPDGYNWLEELCNESKLAHMVNASTYDNKHLPEEYVKFLEESYDEKQKQQELHGQFVDLNSGAVYRSFSSLANVRDITISDDEEILIGQDFNVDPMTSVLAVVRDDAIYVFDEIWLENVNTYDLVNELQDRGILNKKVYADASGSARKTSATKSDHNILRKEGYIVKCNRSNPAIKDRFNTVNGLFHHKRLFIDPKCKKLLRDLKMYKHDNKDSTLSHISDALGYLCWGIFPVRRPSDGPSMRIY